MTNRRINYFMARFALKKALEKEGWTQYKLAKSLDVSVGEVYRWCQKNYNPTLKTLSRISDALGVRIEELVEQNKRRNRT